MAVLFPTQFGYVLKPDKPAELLQGFLNIQGMENSTNGVLTKAQLDSYAQKRFFAVDSNSAVAGYLNQNFQQIAALDGNASSISTNDLVQIRQGLPTPPAANPPAPPPPAGQPPLNPSILNMFMTLLQMMLQMMSSRFR